MSDADPALADRYGFQQFELRPLQRRLLRLGVEQALGARAFDVLLVLVERAGQIVSRADIIERVWPDLVVEENNLSVQINALRKVLGAGVITTVPGRGYQFTAELHTGPGAGAPTVVAAQAHTDPHTGAMPDRLIGRDDDLSRLDALLNEHRLVSIVGIGGIGKTVLARHLLHRHHTRFQHGACLAELGHLSDPAGVPMALAQALGVRAAGSVILDALCEALQNLQLLLVIDNAEHLLPAVAETVARLHERAAGVCLLVTSQAPLKLRAERVYRLEPLAVPPTPMPAERALEYSAVALLVQRAQAMDSRFRLADADVDAAVGLCRALDAVPLAIELAAWRVPVMGLGRLYAGMNERLRMLNASADSQAPPRQQALRATLDWSHALLSMREQVVLRRLALLEGPADLALIQATVADAPDEVALDAWAVLDALVILAERSLLAVAPGPDGELRYRLPDTLKAFARERLEASGDAPACQARHAQAVAARLDSVLLERLAGISDRHRLRLRSAADLDHGRQALKWATGQGDLDLLAQLLPGLYWATPLEAAGERIDLAQRCEALAAQVAPGAARQRLLGAAASHWLMTQPARSAALAQQAVDAARPMAQGDMPVRWLYMLLCIQADALAANGDIAGAQAALQEIQALEQATWPPSLRFHRWQGELRLALAQGDSNRMLLAARQQVALDRACGGTQSWAVANLVHAELAAGQVDAALHEGRALVQRLRGTRQESDLAFPRLNLCAALLAKAAAADDPAACAELPEARAVCRESWAQALRLGLQPAWADYLALLLALERRFDHAAQLMGYADAAYEHQREQREGNEAAALATARALIQSALPAATCAALEAAGASLSAEAVAELASLY